MKLKGVVNSIVERFCIVLQNNIPMLSDIINDSIYVIRTEIVLKTNIFTRIFLTNT